MKVLYLGGWGRSGSTLLGALLGEIDGWLAAGELFCLFEPGASCGCGQLAEECEFWRRVVDRAEREVGPIDGAQLIERQKRRVSPKRVPSILWGGAGADVGRLSAVTWALYRAAAAESDADVVVDTSKHPGQAAMLSASPELYLLHLVRDPRATGYSWSRRQREGLRGQAVSAATGRWLEWNLLTELVARRMPDTRTLRVRYEDLVAAPGATLTRIAGLVGAKLPDELLRGNVARLGPNHILGANPSKFRTGDVPLVPDTEWGTGLDATTRRLITGSTWPMMLRYRYLPTGGRRPGAT